MLFKVGGWTDEEAALANEYGLLAGNDEYDGSTFYQKTAWPAAVAGDGYGVLTQGEEGFWQGWVIYATGSS